MSRLVSCDATIREYSLIDVADANTPIQLDAVRELMRSFIGWHRERHVQDLQLIDEYFDARAFDEELRTLPGEYSPPRGSLLLATVRQQPAGCVALRSIDDEYCEMKRMYVYPRFRGQGAGLALATRLIDTARAAGYRAMRLDTSIGRPRQRSCILAWVFAPSMRTTSCPRKCATG